jgi:hypothetical protein
MMRASVKKFFLLLLCIGLAAIAVALTANALGLSHQPGLGWKKTLVLLTGIGFCLTSTFALSKPRTADALVRVVLGYASFALFLLLATAQRIHLGENPALRWKKALLLIFGLALAGAAVRYKRQNLGKILGATLASIGTSILLLIAFARSIGLPQVLDTPGETALRVGLGMSAILTAIVGLPATRAWLTALETTNYSFGVSRVPRSTNKAIFLAFALTITALIAATNRNWIFGDSTDHWFHVRAFMEPVRYLRPPFTELYQFDRQTWNFFGALFYQLIPNPAHADIALHLCVTFLFLFLMSLILTRLFSLPLGILVSTLSLLCPIILFMLASNYIPGAVALSLLATFYFLIEIFFGRSSSSLALLGAGFFAASSALCRPDTFFPVFSFLVAAFLVKGRTIFSDFPRKAALFLAGFVGLLLPLCLINYFVGGDFIFFSSSVRAVGAYHYFGHDYPWGEQTSTTLTLSLLFFPFVVFWISLAWLVWAKIKKSSSSRPQGLLILYFYVIHSAIVMALYLLNRYAVTKPDFYYINYVFAFLAVAALLDQWLPEVTWAEFWLQFTALISFLLFIYIHYRRKTLEFSSIFQPRDSAAYWYVLGLLVFIVLRLAINKLDMHVLKRDATALLLPLFLFLVLINDGLSGHNLTRFLGPYTWTPEGIKQKHDVLSVGYQALSYIAPRCAKADCLMFTSKEDYSKWIIYNVTALEWSHWWHQSIDTSCQLGAASRAAELDPKVLHTLGTNVTLIIIAMDQRGAENVRSTLQNCGIPVQIRDSAVFVTATEKIYLQSGFLRQNEQGVVYRTGTASSKE